MGKQVSFEISPTVVVWAIVLIAAAVFFWLTAPLWHWLFFSWIFRHSVGWVVLLVVCATAGYGLKRIFEPWESDWSGLYFVGAALLLLVGYAYFSTDVYGRALAESFEPEIVSELPDTTDVRYIPYEVSLAFAKARQENPTKQVGDIDPVEIGGEFFWLAPRIPQGIANWLFSQTDGILLVGEDGASKFEPQVFKCGEGMAVTDAIAWKLFRTRFAAEYPEIFYLRMEDGWVAMAPYITYNFHFPVFVPEWGGVMLVHPDCRIEDLTPQQAQADPRLEGQRLFPGALARAYSERWGYRFGGLWNILWIHREQVEVADLEGTENEMPYFVPTSWGSQWVMAVEPSGPSQSIFKIFWFDTHSGKARLTEFTEADALIGPNRGAQFAKSETPGYVWRETGAKEEAGTYLAIEPRPVIRSETLYWQYSVTTFQYTGVGLTVLVNSLDAEEVLHFCSRASLIRWLGGEGGPDPVPCAAAGVVTPTEAAPVAVPVGDLRKLTDEELYQLLRQIADELQRRK